MTLADVEIAKRRLRMQVRATPDKAPGSFEAKVSTYNIEYSISSWGLWTEKILPGCFADSIVLHPTIPVYHSHFQISGPIGCCNPTEADDVLSVAGHLYLGKGDLVDRVYQAMLDEALEEWSIGFYPQLIITDNDNKMCDQIAKGDLAESSICLRGANPDTGTLELNDRVAWIEGDEQARARELVRVRSLFGDVIDVGSLRARGARSRKATPKHSTADDGAWDGPAEVAKLNTPLSLSTGNKMYAWRDPGKDSATKAAWKLPHHKVDDEGVPGAANVKGCQSVISVLNGGMGGVDIPDADRQAVWGHVAKHLRAAGVEPAELNSRVAGRRRAYQPQPYHDDDDELVTCPECRRGNDSDASSCDQCGFNLRAVGWRPAAYMADDGDTVECDRCGLMNDDDSAYCDQCGYDMVDGDDDAGGIDPDGRGRRSRARGHSHLHAHPGGDAHSHSHVHNPASYDHDATNWDTVAHAHSHDDDDGEGEDPGPDESSRALAARLMATGWGRSILAELRQGA